MIKLLVIADDFTGALDTGVQFVSDEAATEVLTNPVYDFSRIDPDVQTLVLNAETRHLPADKAYDIIYRIVAAAKTAAIPYIYIKTDSALRGNIGSELAAAMDASGIRQLPFIPAFPATNRITREGIHYIDGIPVAESVFGRDPFDPVRNSSVNTIIAQETDKPVENLQRNQPADPKAEGILVYDAESEEDLNRIGRELGSSGLRLSAGCAGFAAVLKDLFGLKKTVPALSRLEPALLAVCGSINPISLRQLTYAQQHGFLRITLDEACKSQMDWTRTPAGKAQLQGWLRQLRQSSRVVFDTADTAQQSSMLSRYVPPLSSRQLGIQIAAILSEVVKYMLDSGIQATLMCIGGDTLKAITRTLGVSQIIPVCEVEKGVVLARFVYQDRTYHIITKSGGFGDQDLLCRIADYTETNSLQSGERNVSSI